MKTMAYRKNCMQSAKTSVSAEAEKNMDHSFLELATGKKKMTSVIGISPAKPVVRTSRAVQELERFIFPVLLIAGWEVFARSVFLPPALLPAPSAVLRARRLGLRLRRDNADLFRSLDTRRLRQ